MIMKTIIQTWHNIYGVYTLVDTVVNVGDKVKFCDKMEYKTHVLEVTEINEGRILAKDIEQNKSYPQWCMLDIEMVKDEDYQKLKELYNSAIYKEIMFETSCGLTIKL